MTDEQWMQHALNLAERAAQLNEVPVGAVLVLDNKVIGEGYNQPIASHDPTAHAEVIAMRAGAERIGNYRLIESCLYVTLEPCLMCAGAMVHARIKKLVFGAHDPKAGAIESKVNALTHDFLNHKVHYVGGVCGKECGSVLSRFFQERRKS